MRRDARATLHARASSWILRAVHACALILALATSVAADAPAPATSPSSVTWFYGGRVWIDTDGDGLPECGPASPFLHAPGDTISLDVWIDTESFVFSSFQIYVEWEPTGLDYVSAEYVISGGQNAAPEVWAGGPEAVGFMGWNYSRSGVMLIGRVHLRYVQPIETCVYTMIDPSYYGEIWSECTDAAGNRFFFVESSSSCVALSN